MKPGWLDNTVFEDGWMGRADYSNLQVRWRGTVSGESYWGETETWRTLQSRAILPTFPSASGLATFIHISFSSCTYLLLLPPSRLHAPSLHGVLLGGEGKQWRPPPPVLSTWVPTSHFMVSSCCWIKLIFVFLPPVRAPIHPLSQCRSTEQTRILSSSIHIPPLRLSTSLSLTPLLVLSKGDTVPRRWISKCCHTASTPT